MMLDGFCRPSPTSLHRHHFRFTAQLSYLAPQKALFIRFSKSQIRDRSESSRSYLAQWNACLYTLQGHSEVVGFSRAVCVGRASPQVPSLLVKTSACPETRSVVKCGHFGEMQTTYHDTATGWIVERRIWVGGDISGTPNRHLIWIVTETAENGTHAYFPTQQGNSPAKVSAFAEEALPKVASSWSIR